MHGLPSILLLQAVFQHSLFDCVPQLCLRLESSILNLCFEPLAFFPGDSSFHPSTFHSFAILSGTVPFSSVRSFSTFSQALSCLHFLVYIGSLTLAPHDTARNPNTSSPHQCFATRVDPSYHVMAPQMRSSTPFLCAPPHTFTCPWHFHFYHFSTRHSSKSACGHTTLSATLSGIHILVRKNPLVFRASAGVLRSRA